MLEIQVVTDFIFGECYQSQPVTRDYWSNSRHVIGDSMKHIYSSKTTSLLVWTWILVERETKNRRAKKLASNLAHVGCG